MYCVGRQRQSLIRAESTDLVAMFACQQLQGRVCISRSMASPVRQVYQFDHRRRLPLEPSAQVCCSGQAEHLPAI